MGLLVDGIWQDAWYDTSKSKGQFVRETSKFHNEISSDTKARFPAEKGRYHLYVSLACPWAHRTLIFRALKNLEEYIDVSIVHPHMLKNGWEFKDGPDCTRDPLYNFNYLYELYLKADANYSGRVTVPVLWDTKEQTIVSNESAEIIRQFNQAFNSLNGNHQDYYPEALREEIDDLNEKIYHSINNGVYRCGFATTQEAYDMAYQDLFNMLDNLERRLTNAHYLVANTLTEADWRLFTTLIRFDAVYYGHFKTNRQRISDYKNLQEYLMRLYKHPGIKNTVNLYHIKQHYYYSHITINPSQIVPRGPELNLD